MNPGWGKSCFLKATSVRVGWSACFQEMPDRHILNLARPGEAPPDTRRDCVVRGLRADFFG